MYDFKYSHLIQIIFMYGFKYSHLIQIIFMYDFKYSHIIQIIFMYGFKYSHLIQIIFMYDFKYSYVILIVYIGLISRVFSNGLGNWGSIPGCVIPKTQKWYLMPPCLTLSIIRKGSRVKRSNPGNGVMRSPTPRCGSY